MTLFKAYKYPRKNRVLITLNISLPLYIDNSNFAMIISGIDPSLYSVEVVAQNPFILTQVSCRLSYRTNIHRKKIKLEYNSNNVRLLTDSFYSPQNRMLVALSFEV